MLNHVTNVMILSNIFTIMALEKTIVQQSTPFPKECISKEKLIDTKVVFSKPRQILALLRKTNKRKF